MEASIVKLSRVLTATPTKRFDAEYFQRKYLQDEELVQRKQQSFTSFNDIGIRVDASAFYPSIEESYGTGSLPFLRVADVNEVIDFQHCTTIPKEFCEDYPTLSQVYEGDMVLTKGGSVARVGFVTTNAAVSRDLIFINTSVLDSNFSKFLYSYARTDFFRRSLIRSSSQTAQPHLTITLVRELPIFSGSEQLIRTIAGIIDTAFACREKSIHLIADAERLMLEAFGFKNWTPFEPLTYITKFSNVLLSRRLDSQYFMPAKEEVRSVLASLPGKSLGERFYSVRQLVDPNNEHNGMKVRNFDLSDALQPILGDEKLPVEINCLGSTKKVLNDGDVVISRLRSYLREIAVVRTSDALPSVGSSEFIVLRPRSSAVDVIAPETLLIFLRTATVQTILKWCQDGSQHPRFSEADLLKIPVPDVVVNVSPEIEKIVKEGFSAQLFARNLLDRAKRAIEIAIEDSETSALNFLSEMDYAK